MNAITPPKPRGRPKKDAAFIAEDPDIGEANEPDVPDAIIAVASETLTGDLRDFILDRLRHEQSKRPWFERPEHEQRDTIQQVESASRDIVGRSVELIAAAGRRTIRAKLAQVTIKDGVKAQLELSPHDDLRHNLYDSVGSRVLIVVADPEAFEGERAPAEIAPDQGDIERALVVHSAPDGHSTEVVF